jgi:hypothetical protein
MDDNDDSNPTARYQYLDAAGLKAATARADAELRSKLSARAIPSHVTRRVVYHDAQHVHAIRPRSQPRRVRCVARGRTAARRAGTSGRVARRATPPSARSKSPPGSPSDDPDPAGGGPRRLTGSLKRLFPDQAYQSVAASRRSLPDYASRPIAVGDQSHRSLVELLDLALAVPARGSA